MPKFYNIPIAINGEAFSISGTYSPADPDQMYRRNGDPGDPGSPAEWEIETWMWKGADVTDLMVNLDILDVYFEEVDEQLCEVLNDMENGYD